MIFVTGCLHLEDETMLQYRKFRSTDEMNQCIEDGWKSKVKPEDTVYVLGDFALGRAEYWLSRLPGRKILIAGNHDTFITCNSGFSDIRKDLLFRFKIGTRVQSCYMNHYPMLSWPERNIGSVLLHAHCHGRNYQSLVNFNGPPRLDMSVDVWQWRPVEIEIAVEAALNRKNIKTKGEPKWL